MSSNKVSSNTSMSSNKASSGVGTPASDVKTQDASSGPSLGREALAAIVSEEREALVPPPRQRARQTKGLIEALTDSLLVGGLRGRGKDRQTALVPEASISGRALIIVIIIMTFLASITAGAVELIATASASWSDDVAREMTIQVKPRSGRDLDADVSSAAEIARRVVGPARVRIYTRAESERLLEPWLGSTLPFDQMPVPRIIVLSTDAGAATPDLAQLRRLLADSVPTAALDDHRQWSARLVTMARALTFVGLLILLLVLAATGLAIAFATRGAMAGTREIINVLHLVGAEDRFIADEFQRHFLLMGLRGGLVGSGLAVLAFAGAGLLSSRWISTPQGEQIEALFGTFGLGWRGYAAIGSIAIIVAILTAIVTRLTVYKNLRAAG